MLICYIHEIASMDVDIASVLKKRTVLKPKEESKDLHKLKLGKIRKENGVWCISETMVKKFRGVCSSCETNI